jgi:hypothetical protein
LLFFFLTARPMKHFFCLSRITLGCELRVQ